MKRLPVLLSMAAARVGYQSFPISVGYELTHLCNLACDYCDRHTPDPEEMDIESIYRVLNEFYDLGMRHISLDGGEPLTHRNIDEIVHFLKKKGVRVYMNTNGILIPRHKDAIQQLGKVKISLDGPQAAHDAIRGKNAYKRAVQGAHLARDWGIPVEFTCVVGKHNVDGLEELLEWAETERYSIVFQPARPSLFLDTERESQPWLLEQEPMRKAFTMLEKRKKTSSAIGNRWSSLRHFQQFPNNINIPCAAGAINVTMDPAGRLYHCGQVNRMNRSNNAARLGVEQAFGRLIRRGCSQCWCARVVEENYAWGGRVDRMLPSFR
jgi:MoaA/NifB/PqqE/SkfB family radical SAM enzyme